MSATNTPNMGKGTNSTLIHRRKNPLSGLASYLTGSAGKPDKLPAHTIAAGDWYRHCLRPDTPPGGWFGLWDCLWRYLLTVILFYWCMITTPRSFFTYTYQYNKVWYGNAGLLLTITYPVLPLGIFVCELIKKVKSYFSGPDWMMAGPGRVFFVKPANPIADLLWANYLNNSMYVGQYLLAGTHPDAISHTWVDTLLTKDFWRSALESVDARVPRELGRWSGTELNMFHDLNNSDLVIKVPDGYLGIGDSFWNYSRDYSSLSELEAKLLEEYEGQEVLVLEMVRPRKDLGVHSLDVITVRTPGDQVKVLSVLLWTNCTTDSSHSCQEGYLVDVDSETIVGAANWYCAAFAEMPDPLIGTQYPGVREACAKAVAAHKSIEEKWLVAVGWDAMVMPKDEVVFFEGNFAGARTPRRLFLSATAMCAAVWNVFWPFGEGNSVTPHA